MAAAAARTKLRDVSARGRPGAPSSRHHCACAPSLLAQDFALGTQYRAEGAGPNRMGRGDWESRGAPGAVPIGEKVGGCS